MNCGLVSAWPSLRNLSIRFYFLFDSTNQLVRVFFQEPTMKTFFLLSAVLVSPFFHIVNADTPSSRFAAPVSSEWRATARTSHQTHWQSVTWHTNLATFRANAHTNSYIELGTGLNVKNAAGSFVPANPSFQIGAAGAEASGTAHKLFVPADILSGEGIKVIQPGDSSLTFQPLGLHYYDPTDGRGVLVDIVTNAVGWLVSSNEIVFSNCFTHVQASIRIRTFARASSMM